METQPPATLPASPAHSRSLVRPLRRGLFRGAFAVLMGLLLVLVSAPLYRTWLCTADEEDAVLALRWIAREMVATGDLPKAGLGAWLQGHDTVAHRMADARAAGSVLEYHGYRIEYVAEGPMAGHLIALPARPGITGRVPYQLALPLRDGSRQD